MDVDVDRWRPVQVPLDTDPLMWWEQEFPRLARMMARQYLTVPATSASQGRRDSSGASDKADYMH